MERLYFMVWPVSLVLFLVASVEESGNAASYVKRFEKNGSVCSYVESILKKDQPGREPWELDSRDLGGIIWEKKGAIDSGLEIAGFDLNNDGNRELLVKQSNWGVHGYRGVQFLEVRNGADASSFSADDLQNQEKILATSGDPRGAKTLKYNFSELPKALSKIPRVEKEVNWIDEYVYIVPFSYEGVSYLSEEDNGGGDLIVSRWRGGEKLEVICYFTYAPKPTKK